MRRTPPPEALDEAATVGGVLLSEFFVGAEMSAAAFRSRYGSGFLVQPSGIRALRITSRPQQTVSGELPTRGRRSLRMTVQSLVFPVRHTTRGLLASLIGVGRTENNDVVIRDESLSKFHAFFQETDAGVLVLKDAGSRNGTFMDDLPAPGKDSAPVAVRSGAWVRFGLVELVFLEPQAFQETVRSVLSSSV